MTAREKRPETRPELSPAEVQKRIRSQPGGEERALREAKSGADADIEDQSDLVAEETPGDTVRRISDRTLDHGVLGPDEKVGSENAGKNKGLGQEGRFSERGNASARTGRK